MKRLMTPTEYMEYLLKKSERSILIMATGLVWIIMAIIMGFLLSSISVQSWIPWAIFVIGFIIFYIGDCTK